MIFIPISKSKPVKAMVNNSKPTIFPVSLSSPNLKRISAKNGKKPSAPTNREISVLRPRPFLTATSNSAVQTRVNVNANRKLLRDKIKAPGYFRQGYVMSSNIIGYTILSSLDYKLYDVDEYPRETCRPIKDDPNTLLWGGLHAPRSSIIASRGDKSLI